MSNLLHKKLEKFIPEYEEDEVITKDQGNVSTGNIPKIQTNKLAEIYQPPDQSTLMESYKFTLRYWWNSIQALDDSMYAEKVDLYERALKYLPGSYKLWNNYLKACMKNLANKTPISPQFDVINQIFERCLIFMNKMPRIWIMYCQFLIKQNKITQTRHTFDRALMALPVTQHEKIWEVYKEWAFSLKNLPLTAKSILKRYLRLNPDYMENYVEYLINIEDWDEAAVYITKILNDPGYASITGKSRYNFLMDLCNLIAKHPTEIKSLDCENIIRHGIKKYTDEVGNLYVYLADYFIRQGLFEKARDIFEEALENIITARDFGIIFNAYVKFEEEMLNVISEKDEEMEEKDRTLNQEIQNLLGLDSDDTMLEVPDEDMEIEYKIYRLEKLIERRPLLLNDCLLRQNPHNVNEWIKRIKLVKDDQNLLVKTYGEALTTIDPQKADGKFSDIWIMFADLYKSHSDFKNANMIYHRATKINFKTIDELATIWCSWIEMHILEGNIEDAFLIIKQAIMKRPEHLKRTIDNSQQQKQEGKVYAVNDAIHMSTKLWSLYVDMENSWGTFETTKLAYQKMLELKIITPQIILNYTEYLQKHHHFEESFKVFEAGINLFEGDWNVLYDLWINYLKTFIERYENEKIERARDLFEKVIANAPKNKKLVFFLMSADMEEKYGLINHAVEVYDKMIEEVPYEQKEESIYLYISKVSEYLGVTKTRTIFEKGIELLKENELIRVGLRYARLEKRLGEIDRSRGIYSHISQFSDPQTDSMGLWKEWEQFELHYGNQDTYREMMRIRRAVLAKFALRAPTLKEIEKTMETEGKSIETA